MTTAQLENIRSAIILTPYQLADVNVRTDWRRPNFDHEDSLTLDVLWLPNCRRYVARFEFDGCVVRRLLCRDEFVFGKTVQHNIVSTNYSQS